jgi:hypothetical protein
LQGIGKSIDQNPRDAERDGGIFFNESNEYVLPQREQTCVACRAYARRAGSIGE